MSAFADQVATARDTFINQMVARGYRLTRQKNAERTPVLSGERVKVYLGDAFPYLPPDVEATTVTVKSFHQDRLGHLCLYTTQDRDSQPWLDVGAFLARIDEWFDKNEAGWPDDPPALDLDVYLNVPVAPRYVRIEGLREIAGDFFAARELHGTIQIERPGKVPKKSTKGFLSGYATSVGELTSPLFEWNDVLQATDDEATIRHAIERDRLDLLLVEYTRRRQRGVLSFVFPRNGDGTRTPTLILSGSASPHTLALRAGVTYDDLASKHVYVLGAGALGSHICEQLSRAGIGRLTIQDGDFLNPGNMTRHIVASLNASGMGKAHAVRTQLEARPYNRAKITSIVQSLSTPEEAETMFGDCDLLVDATADGAVTAMLEDAARANGHTLITACIQNEGATQRVDVVPPLNGAPPLPTTTLRPPTHPEAFESGCGEPISATPPYAVSQAAAMATRHIIGHLVGNPPTPNGEIFEW